MTIVAIVSIVVSGFFYPSPSEFVLPSMIWVGLSVSIGASFYLTESGDPILSGRAAWMYIYFALLILIFTISQGGLVIAGVPRFVFDLTTSEGVAINYSQGISKFYGLAAVFSATLLSRSTQRSTIRFTCIALLMLFLFLSFIGGGRGDFGFAFVVSLLALRFIYAAMFLGVVFAIGSFYSNMVGDFISSNFVLFDRYLALSYSLGMRDTLLLDSFRLLKDEPYCLIFGCGFGFFQNYFNYAEDLYPHNVLIETIISFGLCTTGALAFLAAKGIKRVQRLHGSSPHFFFMAIFVFSLSLKSGTIATSFLLFGCLIFLACHGALRIVERKNSVDKIAKVQKIV
ncbi:hypothetical protein [Kordiimonas lacus]|nr:hypothetical protein [Kordiimonas lacus]